MAVLAGCGSSLPANAPTLPGEPAAPATAETAEPDWAVLASRRLPSLEPCRPPGVTEPVLCGTVSVPEDRAAPDGRRLDLSVVVVPARAAEPPDDPVVFFEGGPGGAATGRAAGMVHTGPVRARDILLVDQRGTGGDHRLECGFEGQEGSLEIFPPAAVASCAAALAERVDLGRYTSVDHADDIEAVRRALGYGRLNLRGSSYGSRSMMVYAERYPESTRTLFGIGIDSPLTANLAERWRWPEHTLVGLAAACAAEPDCARLTPRLDTTVAGLLAGLHGSPRTVSFPDPARPGETTTRQVDHAWMTEHVRLVLYFAFTSRALPWAAAQAEAGDWAPLVALAVTLERMFRSSLADGVLLTIQCSEGMGFDADAALERGADTLFGNYRLEQQLQACALWPHEKRPPLGVETPRPLAIPTLFVSGALDPVTPPVYAEEAATLFPNSLHVVLAEGHHGPFDLEGGWVCIHTLWAELLASASVEGLDTSCTEGMHRPPFLTDAEAFAAHLAEVAAM